jgi:TPR repeat protein
MRIVSRRLLVISIALLAALSMTASALASKRVALVIGNSAYRNVPHLDNPTNDAKLMARTLRGLGFDLVGGDAQVDLDKTQFDAALQSFSNQVQGAEVGLFYYAGHGLQIGGKNFLVPVEANPTKEADVYLQMIDTSIVLSQMEGAGTKLNIVLLDACRNSPFGGRGLRATAGGLAQMQAPEGTLISYATQPGNVALDGADGDSPYTKALVDTIARPGLGLFDAFNEVGLAVKRSTGGAQQPWVSSSPIEGGFYFAGPAPAVATAAAPPAVVDTAKSNAAVASRTTEPAPPKAVAALSPPAAPGAEPAQNAPSPESPVEACDRLAASPLDPDRPGGVTGLKIPDLDPALAVPACRAALAAEPNNPRIMFELARAVAKDGGAAEALALDRKAAAAGHAGAMNILGFLYENGKGVPRDKAEAIRWFRKSAEAGSALSMHRLGVAYERGEFVARDPVEALRWFRKSADAGNTRGMADVGRAYSSGLGVAKDAVEGIKWYKKAAEAGGSLGMVRLGTAYLNGFGVARDSVQAVHWFRLAADTGNVFAMENLGLAYRDGVGVAKDGAEAERWFQRAKQ